MTKAEAKAIHMPLKRVYESLTETAISIERLKPDQIKEFLRDTASDVYLVLSMASEELG